MLVVAVAGRLFVGRLSADWLWLLDRDAERGLLFAAAKFSADVAVDEVGLAGWLAAILFGAVPVGAVPVVGAGAETVAGLGLAFAARVDWAGSHRKRPQAAEGAESQ